MYIFFRDLKPENILCGQELSDLKIADFGLSKVKIEMKNISFSILNIKVIKLNN